MHPTLSRVVSGWAIAGAVCLLAPLCPRPAHASGPTLGLGRKRATVALRLPIVSPLRTIHVGQYPALVTVDVRDRHIFVADQGHLGGDHTLPDGPGSVAMVDEGNGVVLRTIPVSQAPVALAVDAPAQRVFVLCTGRIDTVNGFMSRGGSVSVLDAVTGAVVRTLSVGPVPLQVSGSGAAPTARQALVVDSTNGRVYVSTSATVLVLDGMTGVVRRTIAVRGGITPSVIAPSVIAVDGRARRLYMGDSGDTTMPFLPSSSVSGLFGVLDAATGKGIANVAVTQSGISVIAVDERAGRVLVFELHGNREYSTVVDVLDARSGKLLHTTDLGVPSDGSIAVGIIGTTSRVAVLYIPSEYEAANGGGERVVDIFDTRDGHMLRTTVLPPFGRFVGYTLGQALAIDGRDNRILVANAQGYFGGTDSRVAASNVYVLDARSGAIMRSLQVGPGPQDVAVDEVARRVFVTNERSDTLSVFDAAQL
jgi:DNA-binding beta-propeller fold protein YncE